ncbi:hypothetical protein C8Q77DRAFT_145782 [Trametes polyzona]|nr:hypothetical protein C8Q77DRAFT_145782 [Trametes polyzona]
MRTTSSPYFLPPLTRGGLCILRRPSLVSCILPPLGNVKYSLGGCRGWPTSQSCISPLRVALSPSNRLTVLIRSALSMTAMLSLGSYILQQAIFFALKNATGKRMDDIQVMDHINRGERTRCSKTYSDWKRHQYASSGGFTRCQFCDDPEAVFENTTVSSLCNPATLEWSGDPNDLLVDSPLPTRLNTLHPGIAGWSVDHQVLTVPFCPYADGNVFRYKQYAPHLEDLFAKLHLPYSPSDISHDIAPPHWTSRRGSHCATPGSLSHTAGGDAQGYPALQALAAAISVNIARYGAADMHLTSPCCIVEWQAVAQWWWIVVLGNSDRWQPDDNPRVTFTWSASVRISYTRCIEFDRLVTTFGDRSPETNTTIPLYALTRKHIEEGAINPTAHNKYLVNMDRIAHWLRVKLFPTAADQHDEMLHASYHTWSATKFLRTAAEGVNPDNPTSVLQRGARVCKRMRRRLVKYPLRGTYEAVAVIIHDFFEDFVRILGSGAASDIRAHLSIFEPEPYDGGDLGGPNPLPGSMNNNKTSLHLPLLSVTYQERGCTLENAVRNRERLACVSAARYLSMLGVVDFPVYGLSICGPCAVLSMAWVSDANEHCYVVDRNTAPYRFDLTDETGVARYVSFLAKMKAHGEQLYRRVQEAKPALIERARTEEGRKSFRWTMRAQMDDYELWLPGTEK